MRYEIKGEPMPVVICHLEAGESMITERGSMVWMSENMNMETRGTSISKAFGRMFTGESIFQNIYTAMRHEGMIAFASSFPGSIRAVNITPDRPIIVQKRGFLASTPGVDLSVSMQKKMRTGLFSGEGFIMQKCSGHGVVFIEIDGSAITYQLQAGQSMIIDSGNLVMMDESCTLEVVMIEGVKNVLFGGEGLFNTKVTGPGEIILQTMPISNLAAEIAGSISVSK